MTLGEAPASLQSVVKRDLGLNTNGLQLGGSYTSKGASFSGRGFALGVDAPSIGRGNSTRRMVAKFSDRSRGGVYRADGVTESFTPNESGIEQTFTFASRPSGSGSLVIDVPVSGLTAHTDMTSTIPPAGSCQPGRNGSACPCVLPVLPSSHCARSASRAPTPGAANNGESASGLRPTGSIDLQDSMGRTVAVYKGLRVTDASGHLVTASMAAVSGGHQIAIEIQDAGVNYPVTVDPTWTETNELTASDGAANGYFGNPVAVSGSTAVVGVDNATVAGNAGQGAAYVFSSAGGSWSQTAKLVASDGAASDNFGWSVSASGTTVVVGAVGHSVAGNAGQGAAYVFSSAGGSWSQTAELTASDGVAGDAFGWSVSASGTTVVVGAPNHTVNTHANAGAAYVFSSAGGSWSQTAELTASDGAANNFFGNAVAVSGTTAVVGAPDRWGTSGSAYGAAYVFSSAGGSWSQTAELTASDGAISNYFGDYVALSGTTAVVDAPTHAVSGHNAQGAEYVFSLSGGSWSQTAELTASDGAANDELGQVAVSGTTIVAGAAGHTVSGNTDQGAAYVFSLAGGVWSQTAELTASDGATGDEFGAVGLSGLTVMVGAPYHTVNGNADEGATYVFSALAVVPQGSALTSDSPGGGSGSEPCGCKSSAPAQASAGDPVDTATGDFHETATDLSLPGAGVPLGFSRTYDAQAAQAEVTAGASAPPLGYGWSYNLGMSLSYSSSSGVATVTEENGAQTTFVSNPAGSPPDAWCPSNTTSSPGPNFCATAPRMEVTLNQNSDGSWTYIRTVGGQETFTFNSSGALIKVADAAGDTLSLSSYSPGTGQTACPSGDTCEAWSSSASGRELVLATNPSGQLVEVFDANSSLAATFSYSGTGCSSWGTGETPDLCSATDPGGLETSYTYDSGNSSSDFVYDLLSETPPGGSGVTTNVYNTSGQVDQQTDPAGQVITLAYAGTNSSVAGGTVTVTTYPDGTGSGKPQDQTVYQYSSNVMVGETTGSNGADPSTSMFVRDPVSLQPLSTIDGDGNASGTNYQTYSGTGGTALSSGNVLSSTDAVGNTILYAYNSFNQAWCTVDPADYANGARCPSTAPASPPSPGVSDPYPGVSLSFYNSSGQLTAQTDALGNTTTYSLTSGVTGVPNGLPYCAVDPVDYQKSVTCPAYGAAHVTGTTTATYDSAGDKTSSTDADGNTTSYVYNAVGHPGLVSAATDPDGTVTSYTYNGAGQVISQVATFGSYSATTLYAYESLGRKYCEVDPYEAAQSVTCPSSPPSPPTPSSDPYLGATITTYDSNGRVVQSTNPIGGITYTAYDQAGELFCTVGPYEAALSVTCPSSPPSSPPTVSSDAYLGATITTYDANGRVVQVTNPLGGITLTAYDSAGNVSQTTVKSNNSTSAPNVVTAYAYDADNRVVSTTVGSGSSAPATTLQSYDPNGNVFCSVSANAYAAGGSTYQCPKWEVGWITAPPSPASLYSTTPTSSQANNVTTAFYNANGQQVQTTNPDVATSISVVDGDGRSYCTSDPVNVSAWLSGHSGGTYPYLCPSTPPSTPPSTGSNPGYVTTIFDAAGRTLSSTDQAGDTTATTYDPAGHPLTVTDPRGKVTTNCYYYQNGTGQCAASAPAGGGSGDDLYSTTTPATTADPSGQTTTSSYYPGDELDVVTTVSGKTSNTYDANLDLTSVAYSNTATGNTTPANVTYTYYKDGSRHTMVDGTGTTTYSEDAMGDVTQQQLAATGTGLTSNTGNYSYYSTGALASVGYPAYGTYSAPTANYTYDALGNMAALTDWLSNKVTFTHDGDGNLTSQKNAVTTTNPNGTSSTIFSYDNADQNSQAASTLNCSGSNGTLTQYFSGTNGSRNPDGQVTQDQAVYASPCTGSTYQRDYSYDVAGRVVYQGTTAQGANPNTFAYDASGDPTTISSHDSSNNFATYTQSFDSAGEANSQTPISGSHGVTSTYTYDTLGDQTQTVAGTATTNYGFNQAGQMTSAAASNTTTYQYTGTGLEAGATSPGVAWGSPSTIDGTKVINSVSCASSTFCVAVDANGNAVKYTGTWGTASSIDGTKVINSVSCASSTFCVAVDANGNAVKYTGTWGSASSIDSTTSIASVSCPSSTFCEAVDASGNALKYNGSTWSSSVIDRHKVLEAVSCQSSTFCEAVDNAGNVLKYNGSSWTSSNVDSTRTLKAVSCPTATFCAAVDANGNALTYNGTSWSTATNIDGTTALNSVSCANSTFCQAVDASGNNLTYNGTAWSSAGKIDGTTALDAVSCPSSTFCQAVDAAGKNILYGSMNLTSQLTWDTNGSVPLVLSDSSTDYLYGPTGEPVEQVNLSTSTLTYLTYTPSDSTWISTNAAGNQTGFWGYDAYGNLAFGTPQSPFGYSGQYTDTTTGLVNDRARWYEPQTGGFTTFDPAFTQTDSAYTYAGGDPVNEIDPLGLCKSKAVDILNPWSGNNPIRCQVENHPNSIGTQILQANPAYHAVNAGYNAYQASQQPCSSNWTIAKDSAVAFGWSVATVATATGAPEADGAETAGSTGDLLSGLAGKAQATVGEGSGAVYGTAVHSEFAAEINALGDSNLSTEVSYLNGRIVSYGTRGSVRLDVVEGDPLEPSAVYDLKTGSATLTPGRIAQIQANLPFGYQDIPVTEIRP
jgi:RHS repeat-associated protein